MLMEDLLKLLLALALGGFIGVERELRNKAAGFRTLMFISAGAALFTIFSYRLADLVDATFAGDPGRIAAQIVSGIGFLGAGVILRERGEISGLTTAATIWLVAAIGMGVGAGYYLFSVLATVTILIALFFFPSIEDLIGTLSQTHIYRIKTSAQDQKYTALVELFKANGLKLLSSYRTRAQEDMKVTLIAAGSPKKHEVVGEYLFNDKEIEEYEM